MVERDAFVRQMIAAVTDEGDPAEWTAFWDDALSLPDDAGPPVWLHGDLHGANLLMDHGRLSAVIDWGTLGMGDPAHDLTPAWTLLDPPARALFRAALSPDDASWARGRALAGSMAMSAIPYYRHTNPELLAIMTATLRRVLDDWRG
jgi:aminoglycoside phosphotransferase (APT) family kinase protein